MINYRHEYLEPGDLSRLAKMTESQELSQYFGRDCTVTPVETNPDEELAVTGTLQSGVMEGGQKFSLQVKLVEIDTGNAAISVWQLNRIEVQGLDVSRELVAPVYIPRRYIKPQDDSSLATAKSYLDNNYAFAHTHTRQIFTPGLFTIDNLAGIIHENAHIKAVDFYTQEELDQMYKFYDLMNKIGETNNPNQAARAVREDAAQKGYLADLKDWAQKTFLSERVANEAVVDFFIRHKQINWFKIDKDYHRLYKMVTTDSVSYMTAINFILGEGTIDPILVEYQDLEDKTHQ